MALERLAQAQQETVRAAGWRYVGPDHLALQVARAAEKSHPLEAVRLYLQAAERVIARRGRNNYKEAAGLLRNVRDLYRSRDRDEDWKRSGPMSFAICSRICRLGSVIAMGQEFFEEILR